jgi:hypothetical protein
LAATTAGTGITATYDVTTGTLTLSGVDTVAHYQQVLASMTFSTEAQNNNGRTVSWTVTDDLGATSAAATSNVSVQGRIPAPPPNLPPSTNVSSNGPNTGGQQNNTGSGGLVTDVSGNNGGDHLGPETTGVGPFFFPLGNLTAENLPDGGMAFHVSLSTLEASLQGGPYFIDAAQADGDGLPDWMQFDPNTGVLTVHPPDGQVASLAPPNAPNDVQPGSISTHKEKNGDVVIKIEARDAGGNVATLTFTVKMQQKHSELWPDRRIERQGFNLPGHNEHYVRLASLRDVAAPLHRSVDFGDDNHDMADHVGNTTAGTGGHIPSGRAGLSEKISDFGWHRILGGRAALLDSLQQRAIQQRVR